MMIDNKMEKDTFFTFIKQISERKHGEETNLTYTSGGNTSKVILIGRPEIVKRYGYLPYYDFIKKEVENGTNTFYILAGGELNIWVAKTTAQKLQKEKVLDIIGKFKDERGNGREKIKVIGYRLEKSNKSK